MAHLLKTAVANNQAAKNGTMNGTSKTTVLISDDSDSDSDSSDAAPTKPNTDTCSSAGPLKVSDLTEDGRSQSPRPETAPKLPESVDGALLTAIEAIKLAAKDSRDGKQKFFKGRVNELLLT